MLEGGIGLQGMAKSPRAPSLDMCWSAASPAVSMKVAYFQHRKRWWFRLHEKGDKRHGALPSANRAGFMTAGHRNRYHAPWTEGTQES